MSEGLYASCLTLGLRQPSHVLRLGVNCARHSADVSPDTRRVGFGATTSRTNAFGVEVKRGRLAQLCAEQAGP